MKNWEKLGSGTYNNAYINKSGKKVLKIQKKSFGIFKINPAYDAPERSVRLWNELNPHLHPPARVVTFKSGIKGWICPFIKGVQANDDEISMALIKIFNNTGRIIIDAASPNNFVTTPKGEVVCLDVGQAFQLDPRGEEYYVGGRPRRKSITSIAAWIELQDTLIDYLNDKDNNIICPLTMKTVKALLFIKQNFPDIFDVGFLSGNSPAISRLAKAFDLGETALSFDHDALAIGVLRPSKKPRGTIAALPPLASSEFILAGTAFLDSMPYASGYNFLESESESESEVPKYGALSAMLGIFAAAAPLPIPEAFYLPPQPPAPAPAPPALPPLDRNNMPFGLPSF